MTRFLDAGGKSLDFGVSIENDFVFVWVVDIDSISVWGIERDLISVQGSQSTCFVSGVRKRLGFSIWVGIDWIFCDDVRPQIDTEP